MSYQVLRPYLKEGAVGNEFHIANFVALVAFVCVIGVWLYTAFPMVSTMFGFFSGKESRLAVVASQSASSQFAASVSVAPSPTPLPADASVSAVRPAALGDCSIEIDDCSVDALLEARVSSGCSVVCGP